MFDSHAHINNDSYTDEERKTLINEIESSDLSYVMDIGFDLESSKLAVLHAERFPWCYAAVGIHPHDAQAMDETVLKEIEKLAGEDKVKAIGEIGLDFHYDNSPRDVQEYWFRRQIQLANKLHMPIVIHSRDADGKTMDILKEEGAFSEERCGWFPPRRGKNHEKYGNRDARVLLHCFSGSKELGMEYIRLGATLSIAGPVTYKNNRKTTEVVEAVPVEYLLAETDSPYLTPVPFRGRPNKPVYVEHTIRRIALIKGISFEEASAVTLENAKTFFGI